MDLPKNKKELDKIFARAKLSNISDLDGEYYVDILMGLPSLRKFSHRKIFYQEDNKVKGYNILFKKLKWGNFFLEKNDSGELVINYKVKENSFVSKRIRDYIRCINGKELYIGKFNYMIMGQPRFLGYFSLSKN